MDVSDSFSIHHELQTIIKLVYNPCKFQYSQLEIEEKSTGYGACVFELNGYVIRFRVAKTTPTKMGQFVTIWKRSLNGVIQPFDISDPFNFLVVNVCQNSHFGQFIFPKSVLLEHGIIAEKGKGGKRAFRIYPPWEKSLNKQAKKTQEWQIKYFLEISKDKTIDYIRAKQLYSVNIEHNIISAYGGK